MSDALKRAINRARHVKFGENTEIDQVILLIAALEQRIAVLESTIDGIKAGDEMMMTIARMVCDKTRITLVDLQSHRRDAKTSLRRSILMYLARKNTGLSLLKIAKFVRKDHTSVLYGINKIENLMKTDLWVKDIVEDITKLLNRESPELARDVGIEPTSTGLEAVALPLS